MLETLWYALLLALQAIQTDPQVHGKAVYLDVYIGSSLAYNMQYRGGFADGVVFNAATQAKFGEFEIVRRDGKLVTVVPATDLPAELAEKIKKASGDKDKSDKGDAAKASTASSKPGATPEVKGPPKPFILDFSDSLKILSNFNLRPVTVLPFPAAAQYLADKSEKGGEAAKPTPTPTGTKAEAKGDSKTEATNFTLYHYTSHWVLTADFAQILIVVTVR